jgi:hypothetical protein
VIKIVSDLQQVNGFLWVLWFPPPIKLNIVESGIKHPNPNPSKAGKLLGEILNCLNFAKNYF